MRNALGILIILAGIALAAWLGIYVFLVGGIEQIIAGFNVHPSDSSKIAWGFTKVIFADSAATFAGGAVALLGLSVMGHRRSRASRGHKQARWTGLR